ncbi:MAG: class I SAM-dependent methyltransferase [Cyanobacteria bacterium P01_A01_bin.123]
MAQSFSDQKIIESWCKNVDPWTAAVRQGQIPSRKLVTNQAIVDAIASQAPRSVLDIGCGEGWLVRELTARGMIATGIDGVPGLIEQAQQWGQGEFKVVTYEAIGQGHFTTAVDVAVCNFSLIGKDAVDGVIGAVGDLLTPNGVVIVQTLHPVVACGELPYQDGWRSGAWIGLGDDFCDPAPWYFRTLASWLQLFVRSGLRLIDLREPIHPQTQRPASVIFIAEVVH